MVRQFLLFLVLLFCGGGILLANEQGDVTIRFNGGGENNRLYIGKENTLEFLITNDAPLAGMSLAFSFSNQGGPFSLVTPYGEYPQTSPCIMEHGDAVGTFDMGHLNANVNRLPDSILFGGAALHDKLHAHKTPTLCYSLKILIPAGQPEIEGGFCINNIFYPPAGTWSFNDGHGYPPHFQGVKNLALQSPDAPAVCFDVAIYGKKPPPTKLVIDNCPVLPVELSKEREYAFDFKATTPDSCKNFKWSVAPESKGIKDDIYGIDKDGHFVFKSSSTKVGEVYRFKVAVTDVCKNNAQCVLSITVR